MRQMTLQRSIVCQEADVGEVGAADSPRHIEARRRHLIIPGPLYDDAELRVIEKTDATFIEVHSDDPAAGVCGICCILISELPKGHGLSLVFSSGKGARMVQDKIRKGARKTSEIQTLRGPNPAPRDRPGILPFLVTAPLVFTSILHFRH